MPRSKIKDLPPEPKRRRRGSRDLYEFLALIFWMIFLFSTIILLIFAKGEMSPFSDYIFTWEKFEEVTYVLATLWVLSSIALFLFDSNAVSRENEEFEYHMKNFKELRDNIIQLEKEKIELEKKRLAEEISKE
jgi:cell shape-determining protein MreC